MTRLLSTVLLLTISLLALVLPGGAQAPQKVVFALNWFAVGDHAASPIPSTSRRRSVRSLSSAAFKTLN